MAEKTTQKIVLCAKPVRGDTCGRFDCGVVVVRDFDELEALRREGLRKIVLFNSISTNRWPRKAGLAAYGQR